MRTYIERAEDFIKELLEYKGKNTFEKEYGIRRTVGEYRTAHPRRRIEVSSGAARTAIITSDYVIKIDTGYTDTHMAGVNRKWNFTITLVIMGWNTFSRNPLGSAIREWFSTSILARKFMQIWRAQRDCGMTNSLTMNNHL